MTAKKSSNRPRNKPVKPKQVRSASTRKPVKQSPKKVVSAQESTPTPKSRPQKETTPVELPFTRQNYLLLLIGIGIIALGFLLMSLDDFVDATEFSVSLYIAPIVVVAGFVEIIYAIMYRPKAEDTPVASGAETQA